MQNYKSFSIFLGDKTNHKKYIWYLKKRIRHMVKHDSKSQRQQQFGNGVDGLIIKK
jgi:hypothetical protein